jgi:L(+)-tartrate dehydratase beta subunit
MKNIITTPVVPEAVANLRTGDIFYLSGLIATGRDDVHRRIVHEGMPCPFDFSGGVLFHAGPIVRGDAELVSIGPTTSMRMELWAADFIAKTGVKIIIGKGGM